MMRRAWFMIALIEEFEGRPSVVYRTPMHRSPDAHRSTGFIPPLRIYAPAEENPSMPRRTGTRMVCHSPPGHGHPDGINRP